MNVAEVTSLRCLRRLVLNEYDVPSQSVIDPVGHFLKLPAALWYQIRLQTVWQKAQIPRFVVDAILDEPALQLLDAVLEPPDGASLDPSQLEDVGLRGHLAVCLVLRGVVYIVGDVAEPERGLGRVDVRDVHLVLCVV